MSAYLAGRIAVVTGGGSGLGAVMCGRFATVGMAVGALDIAEARAKETVTMTRPGPWTLGG
jgi:NAD(P)-dependent dehydrogenase (short-subunit alcohol dehydrogenase family)